MAQQSVTLSSEEATTVRGVFQLVSNKIEESKKQYQLVEDQYKALLNTLVTMILAGRGFPAVTNWSTELADSEGKPLESVILAFEDGISTVEAPAKPKASKAKAKAKKH